MNELPKEYAYELGFIMLRDIKLPSLPERLSVNGLELLQKSEFHISLVCAYILARLVDPTNKQKIEKEIVEAFASFVNSQPLNHYRLLSEFRLVQRGDKKTLVAMAEVPGLADFFAVLQQKFQVALPLQPTHITLYTLQPNAGIGILSDAELQRDSELVSIPELQALISSEVGL